MLTRYPLCSSTSCMGEFCPNRYVGGRNTWAPLDMDIYRANAAHIVVRGYSAVTDSATAHTTR